jgi:hypothetical protein
MMVEKLSHNHKFLLVFVDDDVSNILVVVSEADVSQLHHTLITVLRAKHT